MALKIAVISSSAGYIGYQKRAWLLRHESAEVEVFGWDRSYVPGEGSLVSYHSLGQIRTGSFVSRAPQVLRTISCVRQLASQFDVIYAMGIDIAVAASMALASTANRALLVYEIHDIRDQMLQHSPAGRLLRFMERQLLSRIDLLVTTSGEYLTEYYEKTLGLLPENTIVIENKPLLPPTDKSPPKIRSIDNNKAHPLRIGYFGSICCRQSWEFLCDLVTSHPGKFLVDARGRPIGIDDFHHLVNVTPGVTYGGGYSEPEDLPAIYADVDLVWLAGSQGKVSHAWSRTCRFYNACAFGKPIIASTGTSDGKLVAEFDIGVTVDLANRTSAIDTLRNITADQIARWEQNLRLIPPSIYTYEDEHKNLIRSLGELCDESTRASRL